MTPEKRPEVHDAILDCAYRLLSEVPLQKLSMQQVAECAGVSKALLFYHFGSKEELARKAMVRGFRMEMAQFEEVEELDEEMLRFALLDLLQFSLERIYLIHSFIELVDLEAHGTGEDELMGMLRSMYDTIIGLLGGFLEGQGVRYPREKAIIIALAVDLFGFTEYIHDGRPDVVTFVNAIMDMLDQEVVE